MFFETDSLSHLAAVPHFPLHFLLLTFSGIEVSQQTQVRQTLEFLNHIVSHARNIEGIWLVSLCWVMVTCNTTLLAGFFHLRPNVWIQIYYSSYIGCNL